MLREQAKVLRNFNIVIDIFLTIVSFILSFHILKWVDNHSIEFGMTHIVLLLLILFLWSVLLSYNGLYSSLRTKSITEACIAVIKSIVVGGVILITLIFFLKIRISRSFILYFFLINVVVLTLEKIVIKSTLGVIRKRGYNYRNLLIVGTGKRACDFVRLIKQHKEWGFNILGFVDADKSLLGQEIEGTRVLGTLIDIPKIIDDYRIEEVIFITPRSWIVMLENTIMACEEVGVKTRLAADLFINKIAKVGFDEIERWPLLTFDPVPYNVYATIVKRIFDVCFSLLVIIVTYPFWLLIMISIKLTSRGPIFFRQERMGLHGRRFHILKFRTMIQNAEKLQSGLENLNEQSGPVFKIKNDPRLTTIGKFLRRFSLDELPQFINVLKGEMSIVGPRPPLPSEIVKYDKWQRRRLSIKPGITCLWQVMGRNKIDFTTWMKLDLQYIDNWSLGLDMKIIFKTINSIVRATGQ